MLKTISEIWSIFLGLPSGTGGPRYTEEEQLVRSRFYARVRWDFPNLLEEYRRLLKHSGHPRTTILDTDTAKELCPEYRRDAASRIRFSSCAYEPAKIFVRRLFGETLQQPDVRYLFFAAGGTASGKSTAMQLLAQENPGQAALIVDGTLSKQSDAYSQIRTALDAGKIVSVFYIYCPLEVALERALVRGEDRGRALALSTFAATHFQSQGTVAWLVEKFRGHSRFALRILDRTNFSGLVYDLQSLGKLRYESLPIVSTRTQAAYQALCRRREEEGRPFAPGLRAAFERDGRRVG